jgi:hypothetical protein
MPMSSNSSQADSAGSIPVARSTREKRCSTSESATISQVDQHSSASENCTRAPTACPLTIVASAPFPVVVREFVFVSGPPAAIM